MRLCHLVLFRVILCWMAYRFVSRFMHRRTATRDQAAFPGDWRPAHRVCGAGQGGKTSIDYCISMVTLEEEVYEVL